MTIKYRVFHPEDTSEPRSVEVDSFAEFRAWLHDMGVGGEAPPQDVVAGWAELYRRLLEGRLDIVNMAIAFRKRTGTLEIYGR